jgi:phage terminase large subunit-like protein
MDPQTPTTSSERSGRPCGCKSACSCRYVEKANEYIEGVLSGAIPACKWVRLACQRQRDDLARLADDPSLLLRRREGVARCRFIERLPHIKGPAAKRRELIRLEPWQCFILTTVFGWRRRDTGGRRFRRVYVEVPRGNGKSILSSCIALYGLCADGEEGAEVYSAATTRDQAKFVWGVAQAMLLKRPDFAAKIGAVVTKKEILKPSTNGVFVPLSREAKNQDGANLHVGIVDELHAHAPARSTTFWRPRWRSAVASLLFVITTAGVDTSGICYEVRSYVLKVLEQKVEDETVFGIVYTIDPSPGSTPMASSTRPTTGRRVFLDQGEPQLGRLGHAGRGRGARQEGDAAALGGEQLLHEAPRRLDQRRSGVDGHAGVGPLRGSRPEPGRLRRGRVLPGARPRHKDRHRRKVDLFRRDIDGVRHYYGFLTPYLPEAAVEASKNSQYKGWAAEGRIKTTPGDVLDFEAVKQDVLADARQCRVIEVAFDPWQSQQLANELGEQGLTMVEVRPTVANFSAPMKEWDALVRSGRFHHNGCPVFRWMVSNVVAHLDAKDNIYPRKERPENKIDGPVATIMALARAMVAVAAGGSYLDSQPLVTL